MDCLKRNQVFSRKQFSMIADHWLKGAKVSSRLISAYLSNISTPDFRLIFAKQKKSLYRPTNKKSFHYSRHDRKINVLSLSFQLFISRWIANHHEKVKQARNKIIVLIKLVYSLNKPTKAIKWQGQCLRVDVCLMSGLVTRCYYGLTFITVKYVVPTKPQHQT